VGFESIALVQSCVNLHLFVNAKHEKLQVRDGLLSHFVTFPLRAESVTVAARTGQAARCFHGRPRDGVALGNIQTSARIGTTVRLGYHIPDEFAATIPPKRGWYVFSDVGGRGVLYNEFLNGNVFHASHSVDPEPGVLELRAGIVFELGHSEISYTYVYLNKEFKQQDAYDAYGSLDYTYRF